MGSGTFALQAHDPGSIVRFRNIKVKILPNDATPPAGLVPLADRELDQLVTQASNDNIPLIDLGIVAPAGDAPEFWSEVRRLGITPISEYSAQALDNPPGSLLVVSDRDQAPNVDALKAAKAAGVKVAFTSGRAARIDEARLKRSCRPSRPRALTGKTSGCRASPSLDLRRL